MHGTMGATTPGVGFLNLTTAASSNNLSTSGYMSFARVLYHKPVQIWPASFCTSFSFRIFPHFNQLNLSGDGITFVMAQDNKSPANISNGAYLGLQDPLQGDTDFKQLAIEFDTFKNEWDPDGNHIGIDSLSAMNSLKVKTLNSSDIDLKSGKQIKVKIECNGQKKELQIYVGYQEKPLKSFLNFPIKILKYVYIGFTASTGLATETHQLHDWVFISTILSNNTLKDNKRLCIIILASVLPVLGGLVLLSVIVIPVILRRVIEKREMIRRMEELDAASASAPRMFTYKQLAKATKNFSQDNFLGRCGFGSVYEGHLVDLPQTIAVKKISATSEQGNTDFKQLAIEFDTFRNEWDPDDNHIGIDSLSAMKSLKAQTLNSSNIDLKSGKQIKVKIEYDGKIKELQIYVSYEGKPLKSFLNHSIKVSKYVPQNVYIGFTASTGLAAETHQLHDWVFTSTKLPSNTLRDNKKLCIIILASVLPVLGGLVLLSVLAIPVIQRRIIHKREMIRRMEELERQYAATGSAPRMFTYKQLAKATKNFSQDNLLGSGGFGSVYEGHFVDPPQIIAVKKISATSEQGEREYLAEICTIGRLRHRNILQLQGWSHENNHLLLVYDFMANKSLNKFLTGQSFLDWKTRFKILTGLASALLYLHEECGDPVVHRDVKPSNVMLDAEFNPHLGDFGLARLLKNTAGVTTILAGTLGYMAPELIYTGKATTESDVYSFGVVALEVVSGKRFNNLIGENCLVDFAWDMHAKGNLVGCVDPKLDGEFNKDEAVKILSVALACLHLESNLRLKMRKVVTILLNSDEPLLELPSTRPKGVYVSLHGISNPFI